MAAAQEPRLNDQGDFVCEHGTAMDVHCCGCHSGFLFDAEACTCLLRPPADRGEPMITQADQDRPPQAIIDKAIIEAMRSPCLSKRGAVVFNGTPVIYARGHNHQVEPLICTGDAGCKASCRHSAIHAEQAALLRAGLGAQGREMLHVKAVNGALAPSGPPSCAACSRLIVAAGIARMWLFHEDGWRAYGAAEFHLLSVQHTAADLATAQQTAARLTLEMTSLELSFSRLSVEHDEVTVENAHLRAASQKRRSEMDNIPEFHETDAEWEASEGA